MESANLSGSVVPKTPNTSQPTVYAINAYDLGGIASVIGDFSHCGENILTSTVTLGPRRARTELATRHVTPHAVTACPVS